MKLILVLACMSPLFILMAIKGVGIIPWEIYFPTFLGLAIVPNAVLVIRILIAAKQNDRKQIQVSDYTDNREHLLTYIFAMLIPLFQTSAATEPDLYALLCAFIFVVYIFLHMELYYMNFFFAFFKYRVLSIKPDPASGFFSVSHVLITRRTVFTPNQTITPLRLTDFLLFEK
jgi:hypothetical protein